MQKSIYNPFFIVGKDKNKQKFLQYRENASSGRSEIVSRSGRPIEAEKKN